MTISTERCLIACALIATGCTTAKPTTPSTEPPPPVLVTKPSAPAISWTFKYAPTVSSYRISRSAAIEAHSDSGSRREVSTNATHETVSLEIRGDTTRIQATVDTFSTTSQGVIGPIAPVQLPLQLSAVLNGDSLVIVRDVSSSSTCSALETSIMTDLRNLFPRLPDSLAVGVTWKDSADVDGCQASIPTKSRYVRTFRVVGETKQDDLSVLVIQRSDSVQAHGEGAQRQHRVTLDAIGVGGATYYLDFNNGRVVRLELSQDSNLSITASGRTTHFTQNAKESYTLTR